MAHSSGFLGSISTVPDLGWTALIVSWNERAKVRIIDTSRQAPTVDGLQSTNVLNTRRISGHRDRLAEVLLLLPDSVSWAFISHGSVEVTLTRGPGSFRRFQGIISDFDSDCPLDGPNIGRALIAFDGTFDPSSS